jgi:hypothetical protein
MSRTWSVLTILKKQVFRARAFGLLILKALSVACQNTVDKWFLEEHLTGVGCQSKAETAFVDFEIRRGA